MKRVLCLMKKGVKWYINKTVMYSTLIPTGVIPFNKE